MLSFLWDLASFIVALGVLITVHEFGHFWVARRCGVRVERFSIGFGKALWRRKDKQGTEFVIAVIPLGGYVKMLDERVEPVTPEMRHYAFNNKTVGQRAAVIAAGPIANFLFAIVAYWLVFIIGVPGVRRLLVKLRPIPSRQMRKLRQERNLKRLMVSKRLIGTLCVCN
jgi:regulator of sigma E protease